MPNLTPLEDGVASVIVKVMATKRNQFGSIWVLLTLVPSMATRRPASNS
ncbi:MAG: hypothetical protein AAGI30_06790 [Planctomycetota bacterium]